MEVAYTAEAQDQFSDLPRDIKHRILRLAERLEKWPNVSGVKALVGNLAGRYRVRTGDYRVQFHLQGERVVIEKIGHRDRFYED